MDFNPIFETHVIMKRTDTNEYLSAFLVWDHDSVRWSADIHDAFLFKTRCDAEINGRTVAEWLGDPLNRTVKLMIGSASMQDGSMTINKCSPLNVTRVA